MTEREDWAREVVSGWERRASEVVDLAAAVSLASRVEPILLRRARLELCPWVQAGAEADLWHSSMVQVQSPKAMVLAHTVAHVLQRRLVEPGRRTRIDEAWALLREVHAAAPEAIRIEEELTWRAVRDENDPAIPALLRQAVSSLVEGEQPLLAEWAARALPRLPVMVRRSPEAWLLAFAASARLGGFGLLKDPVPEELSVDDLFWAAARSAEQIPVYLTRRDGELHLSLRPGEGPETPSLPAPLTNPILVELTPWGGDPRLIALRPDDPEPVTVPLEAGVLRLRTAAGEVYRLEVPVGSSSGAASSEESRPRPLFQIPPPPADFTGREVELVELREAILRSGTSVVGMRGMGGVGKTALALRLAQELAPAYPDARLYLDLKGMSAEPLTPSEAMAHVIRSFQPEARLPESEAELAALYRSILQGRRALMVMDDAAGAAQIEPLIPPKGSTLLFTSRAHFTLPGLLTKDLDVLPPDAARELLLRIVPRIGEAADEIARLCAYLPLALRLAASALSERPDLSPGAYAAGLEKEQERLGLMEGTLSLSYDLLPEDLAKLWCQLEVFVGSFDAAAAAAVWGSEEGSAEEALSRLTRRSLVEPMEGRYGLHDLTRLFAGSRLGEEDREEARQRHAEHYRDVLAQADDLYLQGGERLLAGLYLFDREFPNVQAGQSWAASHAEHSSRAARLCHDYPNAGAYCLNLRLSPREWIRWLEVALAAARRLEDRGAEGNLLGNLGRSYAILGDVRHAAGLYEKQLAMAREDGDIHSEVFALGGLGRAYADLGEARRSIEIYEQQLEIARRIADPLGEGQALGNLGLAYADLGEAPQAIGLYQQQLQIARKIGDRVGEGQALGNLGLVYSDRGETRRAIELYEQRLQIARELGDRRGESIASWNLGLAYVGEGDLARAADQMQVLVDYEREIGHPDAEKDAAYVQEIRSRILS